MSARRAVLALLLIALCPALGACAGGGRYYRAGAIYRGYYGPGPWWGYQRTIIVDPCAGDPSCGVPNPEDDLVVMPHDEPAFPEPMPMPDLGMPDVPMDMGDFDF